MQQRLSLQMPETWNDNSHLIPLPVRTASYDIEDQPRVVYNLQHGPLPPAGDVGDFVWDDYFPPDVDHWDTVTSCIHRGGDLFDRSLAQLVQDAYPKGFGTSKERAILTREMYLMHGFVCAEQEVMFVGHVVLEDLELTRETDDMEIDEMITVPAAKRTRHGYLRNSFVVDA